MRNTLLFVACMHNSDERSELWDLAEESAPAFVSPRCECCCVVVDLHFSCLSKSRRADQHRDAECKANAIALRPDFAPVDKFDGSRSLWIGVNRRNDRILVSSARSQSPSERASVRVARRYWLLDHVQAARKSARADRHGELSFAPVPPAL